MNESGYRGCFGWVTALSGDERVHEYHASTKQFDAADRHVTQSRSAAESARDGGSRSRWRCSARCSPVLEPSFIATVDDESLQGPGSEIAKYHTERAVLTCVFPPCIVMVPPAPAWKVAPSCTAGRHGGKWRACEHDGSGSGTCSDDDSMSGSQSHHVATSLHRRQSTSDNALHAASCLQII
jgi:hypothetical protein